MSKYNISLSVVMAEIESQLAVAELCARLGDAQGVCTASVTAQQQLGLVTYDAPIRRWPADHTGVSRIWREPSESEHFRWQGQGEPVVILCSQPAPGDTAGYPRATTEQHLDFLRHAAFLAYSLMD